MFVAVSSVVFDALLLAVDLATGSPVAGVGGPCLDAWGLAKAILGAAGLAVIAWWAHSAGWGLFAAIFTVIATQDRLSWHGELGGRLARVFDLTGLTRMVPASTFAWGSFLVLLGVATLGGAGAICARLTHRSLRHPAMVLSGLLAVLFFFAAVVNLWGSARPDLPLGWVEELGEALVLSLALGYVSGLVALGRAWLGSEGSSRGVRAPSRPSRES